MDKLPLSQLIRIGAKLRPQCFGITINHDGHTCALGAAYMAKFGEEPPTILIREALGIPHCVFREVISLNDSKRFTREQIAEHLEQQGL